MSGERLRVGIIGCGNILPQYLNTLTAPDAASVTVVALADLDAGRARAAAEPRGILALTPAELLARDDIDAVVNLTIPAAHADVSHAALTAGKHVYSEKPLAITRQDGLDLLAAAAAAGRHLTCGPDTFMGAGFAQAAVLLAEGALGDVAAANAAFTGRGPEAWHPNPDFFYQPGAGPLLDLGPYYLTHLVKLLGRVAAVDGAARASWPERLPATGPSAGRRIPVATPTHVTALLTFESGLIATLVCSFDVHASTQPRIELHGSLASMQVPDPNVFDGTVRVRSAGEADWRDFPTTQPPQRGRGSAVLDLADAIRADRPPRAGGDDAFHVLDVMYCILEAAESGQRTLPLAHGNQAAATDAPHAQTASATPA